MKRKQKSSALGGVILLIFLIVAVTVGILFGTGVLKMPVGGGKTSSVDSAPTSSEEPTEPYVVATASVGSTGDLLMHNPIIKGAKQSDGSYDFSGIFSAVKPYFERYDLMVANLEVTLAGDGRAYSGYPTFNCPDSIVDAAKAGGVDMLLTANNHTYDTGFSGLERTMQVLTEKGVPFIGTRASAEDKNYTVSDVNGIKIGMVCYTYSTTTSDGRKALNGNVLKSEAGPLVNTFDYSKLEEFYVEAAKAFSDMKAQGAEATIIYVHWGDEYDRTPNEQEKQMAQEISDIGYDVIVGGHPHVVQPMETLVGENGNETVCLYSMGNAVSNQRKERMSVDKSGHTEDGLIFGVTFQKYSDGRVIISDLSIVPTWVDMKTVSGQKQYRIIPLDLADAASWESFMMTDVLNAKKSYNRTMKLVGEGLNAYRTTHGITEAITSIEQ